MADGPVFDFTGERLEALTTLDRIAARGTIRMVLKDAGLDAGSVTRDQMTVLAEKLMPAALEKKGVDDADGVVRALLAELAAFEGCSGGGDAADAFVARTRATRAA